MDLGLFQREIAEKLGADETSVFNWETGRNEPELRFVPAILDFLGHDPRPAPSTLPERLLVYRQARGWSQKRLADALNVDPTTLSRWETGKKEPWGDYASRVNALLASNVAPQESPEACSRLRLTSY